MSIQVNCPSCRQSLRVPDSRAGRAVTCPHCQERLTVPEDALDAETFGPSSRPGPSASSPIPGREERDRSPCPMCGEMIPTDAAKCRFCGEIFDSELRRMERKKKVADVDADMTAGEWVVAILCSGIGCICGIVWMIQGKPKGSKMFGVSFLFAVIWGIIRAALEAAANR